MSLLLGMGGAMGRWRGRPRRRPSSRPTSSRSWHRDTVIPGQVVILDDLTAHKSKRVLELVEGRGCRVLFLPAYSPDLSPIEEAFSKVKALLKKDAPRTRKALVEGIGRALSVISARDAAGWFAHCGYWPGAQTS